MSEAATIQSKVLMCRWSAWRVVGRDHLALDMAEGNCADMSGAIKVATALCVSVRRIDTYASGVADTVYTLGPDGEWPASRRWPVQVVEAS